MKPIRLVVEGFTSFRTRQEVNFDGLELFAISGPTGSGKSSLLDAMMYALFGQIPRLGGQGYQEIISHGARRLSVTLDFEVHSRIFRAVRALKRGGQTTAQLVELDPKTREEREPLADKVKEVDRRVEEMLGLDYEAFAQAVVLPQGEFQRFLKAPARERRKMLGRLLRLERYEVMRSAALRRHTEARANVENAERRLAEDYAGVDEAAVRVMTEQLAHLTENLVRLRADVEARDRALIETRDVAQRTADLAARCAEAERLATRHDSIEFDRRRCELAQRAVSLRDVLDALTVAELEASDTQRLAQEAKIALEVAKTSCAATSRTLDVAKVAAQELPTLTDKIRALDRVIGLQSTFTASERRLAKANSEVSAAEKAIAVIVKSLSAAKAVEASCKRDFDEAVVALERVGYSSDRASRLGELAAGAREVLEQRRQLADANAALTSETNQRANCEKAVETANQVATSAGEGLVRAADQLVKARDALEAEEHQHAAVVLRKDLRVGDNCPVCEQPVKEQPARPGGVERKLKEANDALDSARKREEKARTAADGAREKLAEARTSLREVNARVINLTRHVDDVNARLASLVERLARDSQESEIEPPLPTDAEAIIELELDLTGRRVRWEAVQSKHRSVERAYGDASAKCQQLAANELSQQALLEAAKTRLAQSQADYDEQYKQVRAVAGEEAPDSMQRNLQTRFDSLTGDLQTANQAHVSADTSLRIAEASEKSTASSAESAAGRVRKLSATAATRAKNAGFSTAADARSAILDDVEIAALGNAIREYDAACGLVSRAIESIKTTLEDRRATAEDVVKREHEKSTADSAESAAVAERATLEAKLERARKDLERATALRKELDSERNETTIYGTLARELQTDGFLDYLLQDSLSKLVLGASSRLQELSDRYTLEVREGEFYVVDHDNASETRIVDTLSGGETFLTSLALALELSSEIQATAGAVQLDSIFIDEGFGTLDAETLDTVAGAIESLPHAGRMVGIITHVAELTERMPARIVVAKGADGSSARVVDQA